MKDFTLWLEANDKAVDIAQTHISKKGFFNPPLEKSWPEWEAARLVADKVWYDMKK